MAPTRVRVCGRVALTWHGERIEDRLRARQGRLLFAFLVGHDEPWVREVPARLLAGASAGRASHCAT